MKNSNTLNTRLLPLSILISSLVSGGAMAAPTQSVSTGDFERVAPAGSFMVTSESEQAGATEQKAEKAGTDATEQEGGNTTEVTPPTTTPSEQEITEPEQPGLLDKIKDLLGLGEITEDQAKALTEKVKAKAEKVDAQAAAKLALESAQAEAQKAAEDALYLKNENVSYQAFAQTEEKIKKEADEAKTEQDKLKETAIKAVIVGGKPLNPKDADVTAKVTEAVTTTAQAQKEKADTLDTRIAEAKEALDKKDANTKALKDIEERLTPVAEALTKARDTDKGLLNQKLQEAQEAKAEQDGKKQEDGGYKELFDAHELTKGDLKITAEDASKDPAKKRKLDKAIEDQKAYNEAAKAELDAIAEAEKAVKAIDAKIEELTKNQALIKKEQSTEDAKTGDLDIALGNADRAKVAAQGEFDKAETAAKLAETAAKAIEAAKLTDKAVEDATAAHAEAAEKAKQTQTAFEEAETAKKEADKIVEAKNGLLNDADQALEQLIANQNSVKPTTTLPTIDVTIAPTETQDVIEGTSAIATQVAGGTQNVDKGGKAIDSVVTEDGIVNLAAGANAKGTKVTKGTLNNNGGVDTDTVVDAEGKLVLTGSETAIATSTGAKVAAGGVVTAGDHSVIEKMISSGDVAASGNAIVRDTTINDGKLSLTGTATANNTTFNGGIFSIEGDTTATKTNMTGGKFAVKGKAKIKDTQLSAGNFTLAENATANDTTLNGGKFSISNEATATNTTLNSGLFTLKDGAHADNTTVNSGTFVMADQSTANSIQLVDSAFTLASGAKVSGTTKLTGGQAQVAGSLENLSLIGGRADFANSAKASGLLDISADSQLSMNRGADTAQANLNLAGRLELLASDVAQAVAQPTARAAMDLSNARAAMPAPAMPVPAAAPVAQFALNDVVMTGGTVDMSNAKNAQLTMASLNGTGNFNLGSVMQSDSVAPLNVSGDANGDFIIAMNSSGQAPTNLNVVNTHGGDARFALANGPVALGNYMTNLVKDANGNFVLTADKSAMTPSTAGILAVANTTPVIFNAELSSIQQRLDKQSTEANQSGMWGNYLNNNFEVKGRAANFDQKLNGMTLGGDKATALADGVLSIGGFASYSSSDIKTDYQSKGKVDSHSFGAYAQYLANSGYYMNAVVKNNQFSQDVNITSINGSASGVSNFSGMGIALKAGKHFNFNEAYVSPYVAMSAFSSGKSNISLSNGMEAQSSSTRSAMGTLGVNAGYRFVMNNGAELKPYAIFSVDHEFAKNNQVTVNQEVFDNNLSGTRVNTGAGMNVNITPNLSVGSEVKLSSGKDIKTPVTINLNVGYSF
ncbi:putative autotransporter protein [Yersinia pseudotuberculosis]|uniref:autotransporter outer membrane beta-barrel domain-containing protein n=1 Tax=Yersinia pseudotuberculosis TaxID=633 RepID=UPI0005E7C27B|nr:autotransporter outer membrane beta-barrel domain-containing protein [Yersinia pseudotuberculosis]CNC28536.1 putative autotransporter protein [Yersinia pseudotuberculosis]